MSRGARQLYLLASLLTLNLKIFIIMESSVLFVFGNKWIIQSSWEKLKSHSTLFAAKIEGHRINTEAICQASE